MGHYVYKYVLNGEIIYIGKNDSDLFSRIIQHGKPGDSIRKDAWNDINNADIYYISTKDKIQNHEVEVELIYRYQPKYNRIKRHYSTNNEYVEPTKWKKVLRRNIDYYFKNHLRIKKLRTFKLYYYKNKRMFYWLKHVLHCKKMNKYIFNTTKEYIYIKSPYNINALDFHCNINIDQIHLAFAEPSSWKYIDGKTYAGYFADEFLSISFNFEIFEMLYLIKQQLLHDILNKYISNDTLISKIDDIFAEYGITEEYIAEHLER